MVPRRTLVRALGVSLAAGLAGCNALAPDAGGSGPDTDGPADGPTPTTTPAATPTATLSPTPTRTPTPTDAPTPTPTEPLPESAGTPAFTPERGEGADGFGSTVELAGDTALVYEPEEGVYVFESDDGGWGRAATLAPEDADDFGGDASLALAGDTALVGAPYAEPDGAAYVFVRSDGKWTQRARLAPDGDDEYNRFGKSVAYDGETAVVGAVHEPGTMVPMEGSAYAFAGSDDTWTREAGLTTDAPDLFGYAVAVAGDTALVGAPFAEGSGNPDAGTVYVYGRSGGRWRRRAELTAPDAEQEDRFGRAVALAGDTALVGAPRDEAGRAYVFERGGGGWNRRARFAGTDGGSSDQFGYAVALAGDTAVVGAPGEDATGRAYALERTDGGWRRRTALVAEGSHPADEFAHSVAVAGGAALVGAPFFGTADSDRTGHAYLFDL